MEIPVKRTVYIPLKQIQDTLLKSGYTALDGYSMLNERVEEAVEEMLDQVWRKIDGNRD